LTTHLATSVQLAWTSVESQGKPAPLGISEAEVASMIAQVQAIQQ